MPVYLDRHKTPKGCREVKGIVHRKIIFHPFTTQRFVDLGFFLTMRCYWILHTRPLKHMDTELKTFPSLCPNFFPPLVFPIISNNVHTAPAVSSKCLKDVAVQMSWNGVTDTMSLAKISSLASLPEACACRTLETSAARQSCLCLRVPGSVQGIRRRMRRCPCFLFLFCCSLKLDTWPLYLSMGRIPFSWF